MKAKLSHLQSTPEMLQYTCAHGTNADISYMPVLLVVVYHGGKYFRECVESIKPCVQYFSSSIISINGSEPDEDLQAASQIALLLSTSIFVTGKELTSVEHANSIQRQLQNLPNSDQHIFVLCHDDLLVYDSFRYLKRDSWLRTDPSLSLGNYNVFHENGDVSHKSAFCDNTSAHPTADRAQWRDSLCNPRSTYTNVSGMRMPSQVLIDAVKYMVRTRSENGLRAEYIYAAHHHIDVLYCYNPPLVAIREHSASEGANKSHIQYHGSELRYIIWLFINCRSCDEIGKLLLSEFGLHYFIENLGQLITLKYSGKRGGRVALAIGVLLQKFSCGLRRMQLNFSKFKPHIVGHAKNLSSRDRQQR